MRLAAAIQEKHLEAYLRQLERKPLITIDEVGYIPFDAEAANLFSQLVSSRYERGSVIVTSNKPFTGWGDIFGDPVVAPLIDRVVHQAEILSLKGDTYEILSNDVDRHFEGGDPRGQINGYRGLHHLRVSTGLEAILEADPGAH